GCYSSCYSCYSSCYSCYSSCYSCYSGCYGGYSSGYSGYSSSPAIVVQPAQTVIAGSAPVGTGNGSSAALEDRVKKIESKIDDLSDAVKKLTMPPEPNPKPDPNPKPKPDGATVAKINVQMPAGAKLYVNNVFCPLVNGKKSFTTASLN